MQHIIIDEADLLLGGGFEKDTLELLALLRKYDRDVLCMGWANELGMEWGAFKALPRMVIMAGVKGMGCGVVVWLCGCVVHWGVFCTGVHGQRASCFVCIIYIFFVVCMQHVVCTHTCATHNHLKHMQIIYPSPLQHPSPPQHRQSLPHTDKGGIPAMQAAGLTPTMITRATTNAKPTPPPPPPITHPWERQTVFAAATLPDATKKSVGATIRKYYPDALWLSGDQLHMPVRQVSHVWKEVGDMEDMDAVLRGVVVEGGRVLVFAQDVAAAERVVEGLKGCGLPVSVCLFVCVCVCVCVCPFSQYSSSKQPHHQYYPPIINTHPPQDTGVCLPPQYTHSTA